MAAFPPSVPAFFAKPFPIQKRAPLKSGCGFQHLFNISHQIHDAKS